MAKFKIIILFLIVIFTSCRKDTKIDTASNSTNTNLRTKFKDTLVTNSSTNNNSLFATYCPASTNFFVIQKNSGSQYNLYKCDQEINLIYSKTINLGTDTLMQIKASKQNDAFYTLLATNNFNSSSTFFINAYFQNYANFDSTNNCASKISDYVFNSAFNINSENKGANNSKLNKFDGQGNLVWTKQLEGNYFDANCLETDLSGNIFVLTANRYPRTPLLNTTITNTSSSAPYYDFVVDSNSFSLYKFDNNGNQVFKNTINKVKNTDSFGFNPSLSLSNSNITITNINNCYIFDLNGNLVSQSKPYKNVCYNFLYSSISNPYINTTYISGIVNYKASNLDKYLAKYNNATATILPQSTNYTFLSIDNLENLYVGGGNYLGKIDANGNIIYNNKPLYDVPYFFTLEKKSTATDLNNSLYTFKILFNQIVVYKFDSNGNFN